MKLSLPLEGKFDFQQGIWDSFRYLFKDRKKLFLVFLVFLLIPFLNLLWRFVEPNIVVPHYNDLQIMVWVIMEAACIVFTSAAWYLSAARKDFAIRLISLGSVYYWTFILIQKIPFVIKTTALEEGLIFITVSVVFTLFLNYIRDNYINKNINYKEEYDGMVFDYQHLCRGFTKTVDGLNHLKKKGYITEEEYSLRLSTTTERFDEFATKIHQRYQELI